MKRNLFFTVLALMMTVGFASAQQPQGNGMFGIDHEKKIVVATGKLPEGIKPFKSTIELRGETYTYYRSEMPLITITTDGPIVNSPAVHGLIRVADANGNVIEMHAGFKIRGTSSQQYDKKSYRVELWKDATGTEMADTTFLGMRSDDDWNLEAMWTQPLRLRDKVANELWMEMYRLPYAESEPDALPGIRMEYADLFINDTYLGVYALTERMDRKQLALRKFNGEIRGVLYKGNGPGAPTFESLPSYDNTQGIWDNYEWVYPNEDEASYDWNHLYSFTNFVMNASDNVFYSQYAAQFDKANAIDYFLFINVLKAMDNMGRNLFLARYKKSSAYLYLPWDLDAIWGLDTDGHQTDYSGDLMTNGFFDRLRADCTTNGFVASARTRYNTLRNTILTTDHIMARVQNQYDELLENGAYDREHEAWPSYTLDDNQLKYISDWLDHRFSYLDGEINAECGTWDADEWNEIEAKVYPNPSNGLFQLNLGQGQWQVTVFDFTGRKVLENQMDAVSTLDLGSCPKGLYLLKAQQEGQWVSVKIVKN